MEQNNQENLEYDNTLSVYLSLRNDVLIQKSENNRENRLTHKHSPNYNKYETFAAR